MNVRDEEILRLKKYLNALGVKVRFLKYKKDGSAAAWLPDTKTVEVYKFSNLSKTQLVLNILHEAGHVVADLKKKSSKTLEKALSMQEPLSKKYRRVIFLDENRAAGFRYNVYEDCNISLPRWKLTMDIILDLHGYHWYYKNGKELTIKQYKVKRKKLTRMFKEEFNEK